MLFLFILCILLYYNIIILLLFYLFIYLFFSLRAHVCKTRADVGVAMTFWIHKGSNDIKFNYLKFPFNLIV